MQDMRQHCVYAPVQGAASAAARAAAAAAPGRTMAARLANAGAPGRRVFPPGGAGGCCEVAAGLLHAQLLLRSFRGLPASRTSMPDVPPAPCWVGSSPQRSQLRVQPGSAEVFLAVQFMIVENEHIHYPNTIGNPQQRIDSLTQRLGLATCKERKLDAWPNLDSGNDKLAQQTCALSLSTPQSCIACCRLQIY